MYDNSDAAFGDQHYLIGAQKEVVMAKYCIDDSTYN